MALHYCFYYLCSLFILLSGCIPDIPATNPYDPDVSADQQQTGSMSGTVEGGSWDTEVTSLITGATVTITGASNPANNPLTTTSDGAFNFENLIPGRYLLQIAHPTYYSHLVEYQVDPGEARTFKITLERLPDAVSDSSGKLKGIAHKSGELVVAEADQDHSGIIVEVEGTGERTVTNSLGAFEFSLAEGTYNLILSAPDYNEGQSNGNSIQAGVITELAAPIVLSPNPGIISGKVTLEELDAGNYADVLISLEGTSSTGVSAADGTYQLNDLAAGTYIVRMSKDGYAAETIGGVEVRGGREASIPDVHLVQARGTLSGAVTLAAALDHGGIAVSLSGTSFSAITTASGDFQLPGIPVGNYEVTLCRIGYASRSLANITIAEGVTTDLNDSQANLELAAHQIQVSIDSGAALTSAAAVTATLDVPQWVTHYRVDGDVAPTSANGFTAYNGSGSVQLNLSAGDGLKSVDFQFAGSGCEISNWVSTSITLDSTRPSLSGLSPINGALKATTDMSLILGGFEVEEIRITGDVSTVEGSAANVGVWLPMASLLSLELTGNVDGDKSITVEGRDAAGNLSQPTSLTQNAVLDRQGPTGLVSNESGNGILLNEGASLTNDTTLKVVIGATDATTGVAEFKISDNESCSGGAWSQWPNSANQSNIFTFAHQIAPGDNIEREVSVAFRDGAGNESGQCLSDTILIDTTPLILEDFALDASSPTPGFTKSTTVEISSLSLSGVGDCRSLEFSQSPLFPGNAVEKLNCVNGALPVSSIDFTLTNVDVSGEQLVTIYGQVIDEAGNFSDRVSTTIFYDARAPDSISPFISRGAGSIQSGVKYTNEDYILVGLPAVPANHTIFLDLTSSSQCSSNLSNYGLELSPVPSVVLGLENESEGTLRVCVALRDAAGNDSSIESDTIIFDQSAPSVPGVSPSNLSGVNQSCANITPTTDASDFWKWETRGNTGDWAEDSTASGSPIEFALNQDTNNILSVRAIDKAGNISVIGQSFIEEISSFVIPTNLQVKQVCNGGEYAILKDMDIRASVFTQGDYVRFAAFPEHSLIALEDFAVRELTSPISAADVLSGCSSYEFVQNRIIDAACSAESGEPALLLTRGKIPMTGCTGDNNPLDEPNLEGEVDFWVYPDPYGTPMGDYLQLTHTGDEFNYSGDVLGVTSVDVLDWTGSLGSDAEDYTFRALAVDAKKGTQPGCNGMACLSGATYSLRRLSGSWNTSDQAVRVTPSGTIDYQFMSIGIQSFGGGNNDGDQYRMRGLSFYSSSSAHYLKGSVNGGFTVGRSSTSNSSTVYTVQSYPDPTENYYGSRVHSPLNYHPSGTEYDASHNFLFINNSGNVYARRTTANTTLGSASSSPDHAAFFEYDEGEIGWVDYDNGRTVYLSNTYGENPQNFRYKIDTSRPIHSVGANVSQAGVPFILYHTSELLKGVVIGLTDEAGCAQ